jgi:hypothetical protein
MPDPFRSGFGILGIKKEIHMYRGKSQTHLSHGSRTPVEDSSRKLLVMAQKI